VFLAVNEKRSAARQIVQVVPKVMRVLASTIRQEPSGIAPAHFHLMFMLAKQPRSLTELAESQSVSLATMSNSVSVLADRGWVARRKDPADRRRLALEITPEGQAVLREVHRRAEERLDELLVAMSAEQCRDLLRGLDLLNSLFASQDNRMFDLKREE
jgi:DNA-binding MarR family transcriptional regulator